MSASSYANCPKCKGSTTVREDYRQGIYTFNYKIVYFVDYAASCPCGFEHKFKHEEILGDAK